MDLNDGISLISKAYEKQSEDRAFQMYLERYAWMDEKSFQPFEEFYKPKSQTHDKPVDEILNEVKETLEKFKGRWRQ